MAGASTVIKTEESHEYIFFPLVHGALKFKVKARNDVHVALSTDTTEDSPTYEIIIGGMGNTMSAIFRNHERPHKAIKETPFIVSPSEDREFWISWNDGNLEVRHAGQTTPFLRYNDPEQFSIGFYGIRTTCGASGKWVIEDGPTVKTQDSMKYQFYPVPCGAVTIDVRCKASAHISLISSLLPAHYGAHPYLEIILGGWDNSRSVIKKNGKEPYVVAAETPNILTDFTYRRFRVRWNNGNICIVAGGTSSASILNYQSLETFGITYIGVRSTDSVGHWRIKGGDEPGFCPEVKTTEWVRVPSGILPAEAFIGGKDHYSNLYVGQAYHEGDLIPGKVNPKDNLCYIPWRGKEIVKREYQVLCGTELEWVPCNGSNIPSGAVRGGRTENGEVFYIGRVPHSNTLTIGK
ncbi:hypothetical protein J437_LFUL004683, partial [Ladona fulva]